MANVQKVDKTLNLNLREYEECELESVLSRVKTDEYGLVKWNIKKGCTIRIMYTKFILDLPLRFMVYLANNTWVKSWMKLLAQVDYVVQMRALIII